MKKYILLVILICATVVMGVFVINSAHHNTAEATLSDADKVELQVAENALEDNSIKETIMEGGKKVTKRVAEFLFSFIYK